MVKSFRLRVLCVPYTYAQPDWISYATQAPEYFTVANTPRQRDLMSLSVHHKDDAAKGGGQISPLLAPLHAKKIKIITDQNPYMTSQIPHSFPNKSGCAAGEQGRTSGTAVLKKRVSLLVEC